MPILSAGDLLKVGVDLERTAAEFYARAARQMEDRACRSVLRNLSRMEKDHEHRLQSWRGMLPPAEQSVSAERIAEARMVLGAGLLLDLGMDPGTWLTGNESPERILELAIGFEESTIRLYTSLTDLVPSDIGREQVEALRAEEYRHRQVLREQLVVHRVRSAVRPEAHDAVGVPPGASASDHTVSPQPQQAGSDQ